MVIQSGTCKQFGVAFGRVAETYMLQHTQDRTKKKAVNLMRFTDELVLLLYLRTAKNKQQAKKKGLMLPLMRDGTIGDQKQAA